MSNDKRVHNDDTDYVPVQTKDEEPKKYPRAVFIIVLNEFCERFSYSGMRAFLALYLTQKLFYSDDEATEIYHVFTTMAYFFAIVGAILADSYIGKFRTILYLMVVYALGNVLIAVTAVPHLGIPAREFTVLGLMMVALGTGGIKPCVSSFGGDQFSLPEQDQQLTTFFSVFYFILCLASLIAKSVSPLLRSKIQCFGDKDCYSIAFGAPGILIIISIVLFGCAKRMFIIKKPTGNVLVEVAKCICVSLKNRRTISKVEKANKEINHWLDYARGNYDQTFIDDVKKTLRVFLLFTPLPVFWALLDQLGSRWTLQARQMDGDFGFFNVKPDQMQVLCPISILIFIPIFKKIIYPFLTRHNILTNLLHRLVAGCILAGIAYICTGLLEMRLEKTYPNIPSRGNGQLRIYNCFSECKMHFYNINNNTEDHFEINPLQVYELHKELKDEANLTYNTTILCPNVNITTEKMFTMREKTAMSFIYDYRKAFASEIDGYEDDVRKSRSGLPFIRVMTAFMDEHPYHEVKLVDAHKGHTELKTNVSLSGLIEVFAGEYHLYVNQTKIPLEINVRIGGVYTIIVSGNKTIGYNASINTITQPNSISMAWVLPQIIIISMGEVLFAITGLEFAFKEAPDSMKAVSQAYWLLIEAFGNILIIVVTRLGTGYRQMYHFFFFAMLMFVSTFIFFFLARNYESQRKENEEAADNQPFNVELDMNNVTITSQHKYMELLQIDDTLDH